MTLILYFLACLYVADGLYLAFLFLRKEIESDCPYKRVPKFWFYVGVGAIVLIVAGPIFVLYGTIDYLLMKGNRK